MRRQVACVPDPGERIVERPLNDPLTYGGIWCGQMQGTPKFDPLQT